MKPSTSTLITSGTMTAGEVTYPSNHGTVGQVLTTEGSGELAWTTVHPTTPISASTLITSGTMTAGAVTYPSSHGTAGQVLTTVGSGELAWATITPPTSPVSAVFLPTIVIGTQQWMRENLDVVTYRNGDIIPEVKDGTEWGRLNELKKGAWCYYNNDPETGAIYGKLYNWYAVNDPRGLAPQGWHIPTDDEWTILSDKLGGLLEAGNKMRTPGNTWMPHMGVPNEGTNESGFTGLPGGVRRETGNYFSTVGACGLWWSATVFDANFIWFRMLNQSPLIIRQSTDRNCGMSVRCLRD